MPLISATTALAAGGSGAAMLNTFKTGFQYNRVAFQYDQTLRWSRFTSGRKFAQSQTGQFRQDVEDLASVTRSKLKNYGAIMTMSIGYCVTVLVEGRSGLKFPGPPTFISGLYLQCLGVSYLFFTMAIWFLFHASLRAQAASVHLRTRKVRLPVPTQGQLDGARRLLSSFEEEELYDIFKLPYFMPNRHELGEDGGNEPEDNMKKGEQDNYGGASSSNEKGLSGAQIPGFKKGVGTWIRNEYDDREESLGALPSGGVEGGPPWPHFELLRKVQKEWWAAEVYNRICMLYGMIHFLQAFSYWFIIHCFTDLGLIWAGIAGGGAIVAAVWLLIRLDVLPEAGGRLPVEFGGPFVASIACGLSYTHSPTQFTQDASRIIGAISIVMHIMQCLRMYLLASPGHGKVETEEAKEAGGRYFNNSAACYLPSWLPLSFQVCTYLIPPPMTPEQRQKEQRDNSDRNDGHIDMHPWKYTRVAIQFVALGWFILLSGRIVESVMGERMLMTNAGTAPWTRRGLWYGWEFGPITSKHYAHVTPQRGHYSWQVGWGPQGQQELWPSDLFGFHPEADMWWSEASGPRPGAGAPFHGENIWMPDRLKYGLNAELAAGQPTGVDHAATFHSNLKHPELLDSGAGHKHKSAEHAHGRRLRHEDVRKTLVPAAVQWPPLLEPEIVACGPGSSGNLVAALSTGGFAAVVPQSVAVGEASGQAAAFSMQGLSEFGSPRGLTVTKSGVLSIVDAGNVVHCSFPSPPNSSWCHSLSVPKLPEGRQPAAILPDNEANDDAIRAVVAVSQRRAALFELKIDGVVSAWKEVQQLEIPFVDDFSTAASPEIIGISANAGHLLIVLNNGKVYRYGVHRDGSIVYTGEREAPPSVSRTWHSACALSDGQIVYLASGWRKAGGGSYVLHPELLF